MTPDKLVVAIPARNEAKRIPSLLEALAHQTIQPFLVIFALNNTTDHSLAAIEAARRSHADLKILVDEITFPENLAHAGSARRRAMDLAADIVGAQGFILTTDADTRPPPDWVKNNHSAMMRKFDIVGGRIAVDEREYMHPGVVAARDLADRYWAAVRHIEDAIDPVSWDPPPRHGDHTGASLCVTAHAYRQCGGVPIVPSGEDRGLVQAVLRQGGRLAHPLDIWTRVSPRLRGRATGGMAEHLQRLQSDCAADIEVRMPSFEQWTERAQWRRDIRKRSGSAVMSELESDLPPMKEDMVLNAAAFEHLT